MRNSASLFVAALSIGCSAIALGGGCSSTDTMGKTPPLAGGTGGNGGENRTASSSSTGASSPASNSSSSHAASSSGTGGSAGAGGAGGSGGSVPASCTNQVKDGDETDVDCGGSCPPCDDYDACKINGDCQSKVCKVLVCQPASCTDGVENEDESDIDCGGLICDGCLPNKHCNDNDDCQSHVCSPANKCLAPTCSDKQQNGDESDVDCGGNMCPNKCDPGQKCNGPNDCVGGICEQTCQCPQGMVIAPYGTGTYCIDVAEVSRAAYLIFLDGGSSVSQPSYCSWNNATPYFQPTGDWPALNQNQAQEPVRFVNWCDADAYCRYVGKHLCGKIQGGATAPSDYNNAATDQWFNACSANGTNSYPYGSTYHGNYCNGADDGLGAPWVSPQQNCAGGEFGLYDMSGDVAEWEDGCDAMTGETDLCPVRGGSFASDDTELRCDSNGSVPVQARDYAGRDVGIRCCL